MSRYLIVCATKLYAVVILDIVSHYRSRRCQEHSILSPWVIQVNVAFGSAYFVSQYGAVRFWT